MTALLGRATACLGSGEWDPVRLGSAIATHAHCAEHAPNREIKGMHNDVNGTSAGDAERAVAVPDSATETETDTAADTGHAHGHYRCHGYGIDCPGHESVETSW